MPGIRDDIIIKMLSLIGLLKAAAAECEEVEKCGLLADCQDLDAKLHAVYVPFRDTLIEVTEEMKERVTKKLIP